MPVNMLNSVMTQPLRTFLSDEKNEISRSVKLH